jgi:hypothetical protein
VSLSLRQWIHFATVVPFARLRIECPRAALMLAMSPSFGWLRLRMQQSTKIAATGVSIG